jgi:hypothetical protein
LGEKGGGKRYYGTTPFELTVRVEKIKLCPVDRREERIRREEEGWGTMALPQKELTVRVEKIKLCPFNRREERIRREEEEEYGWYYLAWNFIRKPK